MRLFRATAVVQLTGANRRTLNHWTNIDVIPPVYRSKTRGDAAEYSFRDVVAVRAVVRLRSAGVSLQAMRKVADFIRNASGAADNAEALAGVVLAVEGDDVRVIHNGTMMSALKEPGQVICLAFDLGSVVTEVTELVRKAA